MPKLLGEFEEDSGRPRVYGYVAVPRLRTALDVRFLVDTGADTTVIAPADAIALGIDTAALTRSVHVGGITGRESQPVEAVNLSFRIKNVLYVYSIQAIVLPSNPGVTELPSLLGRDVLNRWNMDYRPQRKTLAFDLVSFDEEFRLKQGQR